MRPLDDCIAQGEPETLTTAARQRDANALRLAARLIESIQLPDVETHAGRTAMASVRRWQTDLAAGARGHAQTLES